MSVSIREIARLAGVSRGTVDRALNNRPGINPQIKQQILRIADEVGYRSNRAGRMLGLRKKPLTLGVQMPADGNDFFLDVSEGLEEAAAEFADAGLSLRIETMKGYSVERQLAQLNSLLDSGVNGLAFVPIDQPPIRSFMQKLARQDIPVITLNSDIADAPRLCYVGNDYTASGRTAGGLLGLLAGDRPLETLIMTGSVQVLGHNQRIRGFSQVVREHYPHIHILDIQENQDDDRLSEQLVADALQRWPQLNALYLTAGGVAGACRAVRRAADRRLKIVSFDQTRATEPLLQEGLITASISQEPRQQGYQAIRLLFDYLLDGSQPPERVIMPNHILIREHLSHRPDSGNRG